MLQTLRRFRQDRQGDVWAFISVAILFIGMPLASLTVDVVRGMYVRTHLQVAADAACQAAADALDVPVFRETGIRQINFSLARSQAASVAHLIPLTPAMNAVVATTSEMRVVTSNP